MTNIDPTPKPEPQSTAERIPLTDLGSVRYLGFEGGLYPDGNTMPAAHA